MVFFLTGFMTGIASSKDPVDLSTYQWKNRVLLLFASSEEDPFYQDLKGQVEGQRPGIADRDVIIIPVLEKGRSQLGKSTLTPDQSSFLRERFRVGAGRLITVLIGKDGGVKLKKEEPIKLADIFSLIDAMPMRQREMQEGLKKP